MPINDRDVKRMSVFGIILLLVVASFIIIKPILLSVITGLILAYAFLPLYKKVFKIFKERNTSALAVSVLVVLIILIPIWFLVPLVIQQGFNTFTYIQTIDLNLIITKIVPTSTPQFQQEITSVLINFVGTISSSALNSLLSLLLDLPTILLHLAVVVFVFFFTLRDHDKLKEYVSGISPFKKENEKILAKQFRETTSSIIFGFILVGIIQGVATGIGLLIFKVPNALLLTILAILASIIPLVGPWLVWVPAAIYLFISSSTISAILFSLYSVIIVSSVDNILRPYIVSRKTGTSSVVVLVGMIGGLFVFGVLGLILGPLILSYLILFLTAYKNKTLSDMFTPN